MSNVCKFGDVVEVNDSFGNSAKAEVILIQRGTDHAHLEIFEGVGKGNVILVPKNSIHWNGEKFVCNV